MANNLIQIKRSTATAAPTTLSAGELAYSNATNVLFIGDPGTSAVTAIGGVRSPGTLTANQALVANSTSGIDKVITANLVAQSITVNNSVGTAGYILKSGGPGSNSYWTASAAGVAGTDTQVQFNDGGSTLAGAAGLTFNKTTNNTTVANTLTVNSKVQVGTAAGFDFGTTASIEIDSSSNTFIQAVIQNANTGTNASADLVVTNDTGNNETGYVDLGINSSLYSNTLYTVVGAGDGYLYASNGSLGIGTATAKPLIFHTNGTLAASEVMRIDAGANVGIGNTAPNAKLQVTGTANISGAVAFGSTLSSGNQTVTGFVNATSSVNSAILAVGTAFVANSLGAYHTGTMNAASFTVSASFIANSILVVAPALNVTAQTNTATFYATTSANVGANVQLTTSGWLVGNSVANTTANSILIQAANSTTSANLTPGTLTIGTSVVNSSAVAAGSNNYMNLTTHFISTNTTVNSSHTATLLQVANSTATANLTATALNIGATTVVNTTQVTATLLSGNLSASYANVTGQVNTATFYASTSANVGANVQLTTSGWAIGNSVANSSANSILIQVENATNIANLTPTSLTLGTTAVNTSALSVSTAFVANSTKVTFTGANVDATSAVLSIRDIVASGNLTINGTLTTIDTNTLQVKDAMIKIADQNLTTDTIDFGIYGAYGNSIATRYAGLYRDHTSGTMETNIFKLFNSTTEPTSIVDNTAVGYTLSTLNAYLLSSALVANSTTVTITANSTVNVNITANTLTLSSGLAPGSGGTGLTSYTTGDLLYASGSSTLAKLGVAANGQVLQITNNLPAYGTLDGGTF